MKNDKIFQESIEHIEIDPKYNVRQEYGDINELSDLILQHGITTPLMVKPHPELKGKYILIRGHRRLKAVKFNLKNKRSDNMIVPIQMAPEKWDEVDLVIDQEVSNSGLPLNLLEKSEIVKRLVDFGMDDAVIADRMGKSITFVRNCHQLLKAPADIKKMIKEKRVSATLVITMFKKTDYEKALRQLRNMNAAVVEVQIEMDQEDGPTQEVVTSTTTTEKEDGNDGKITNRTVNELEGVQNSVSFMKKIIASKHTKTIRYDHLDVFNFVSDLFAGNYTKIQLEEMFYEPQQEDKK